MGLGVVLDCEVFVVLHQLLVDVCLVVFAHDLHLGVDLDLGGLFLLLVIEHNLVAILGAALVQKWAEGVAGCLQVEVWIRGAFNILLGDAVQLILVVVLHHCHLVLLGLQLLLVVLHDLLPLGGVEVAELLLAHFLLVVERTLIVEKLHDVDAGLEHLGPWSNVRGRGLVLLLDEEAWVNLAILAYKENES
jgi:hypothetical protein